jgi:hypothetical protein
LAIAARDTLLKLLGFKNVKFNDDSTVKSADAFSVDGFILANGVEGNGRIVGFAFAGSHPPKPDGGRTRLDADLMERSANIELLKEGLVYATLYKTLPYELIVHSREIAEEARKHKKGVFGKEDVGVSHSAKIDDLADLQKLVLLPKLFRRLADFFVITEESLSEFDSWIREDKNRDDAILLPSGEAGNLHDLYEVDGDRLQLRFNPEDMQVLE